MQNSVGDSEEKKLLGVDANVQLNIDEWWEREDID